MIEFKPVHSYSLNLGKCKGEYKLHWDFDPTGDGNKTPCRVTLKWGNVFLDTGFRGDSSYNSALVELGYPTVLGDSSNGFLLLTKNEINPTIAEVTVYTPLEESLVQTNLICPTECLGAPSAPVSLQTGYLYTNVFGYTTVGSGQPAGIYVSWVEPEIVGESNIENYVVQYSYDAGDWIPYQTVSASQKSLNITNLSGDLYKYAFRVAGINVSGKGDFSVSSPVSSNPSGCVNSIYWHVSDDINENNEIYTMGDYVAAYNIGGETETTVGGVSFKPVESLSSSTCVNYEGDDICLNITTTGDLIKENSLSSQNLPFSGLSAGYRGILSSLATSSVTNLSVELDGLKTGHQYLVQLWSNVSKQSDYAYFGTTQVGGFDIYGGNINVNLLNNSNNIEGKLGKNIVGTFVSCGTKLKISLQGLDGIPPVINAFQIREIKTKACCHNGCTLYPAETVVENCCPYDSYQGQYECGNGFYVTDNCWFCWYYWG